MSVKKQVVSGVKWSTISQVGRQAMQLVTIAILARFLTPDDYGLVGMASIVIGFAMLFSDLGTASTVIQRQNISEPFLSSIFWFNAIIGCLACVTIYLSAPLIAGFYQEPRLTLLMQVLSFNFLVAGGGIVQKALLERKLEFYSLAKIEIIASVVGSITGISAAVAGFGPWSLVYQTLVVTIVTTTLLWLFAAWQPKRVLQWSELRTVYSYSLNLTGFNIFNYFARNADYLLIGRFLGSQALGYYTLAYRVMLYPLQNISSVLSRVLFPSLSLIQNDQVRFRSMYLRATGIVALVAFPLMLGLMGLADTLILVAFGVQWLPVASVLTILAPVGMLQSVGTLVGIIYQAMGRTDWMFRWGVGSGLLVILAFAIGLQWGILGVAAAYALIVAVISYPSFAIPFKLINLPMRDLLKVLWRPLISSGLMLVVVMGLKLTLVSQISELWVLLITVPIGVLIYAVSSLLINHEQFYEALEITGVSLWIARYQQRTQI